MPYASSSDVSVRWGRALTLEETQLVDQRLADVERMTLRRIPDLAAKIEDDTIDVDDVVQVEADAVLRLVRNPDGVVSETDGNYSYVRSRELASGKLEITPEEWAILGITASVVQLVPTFTESASALTVHPFMTGG